MILPYLYGDPRPESPSGIYAVGHHLYDYDDWDGTLYEITEDEVDALIEGQ